MDHIVLAAAEGETHSPVLPVWSEVILALIVFAILFVLMRKFVVPNFEKTFAERRDAIRRNAAWHSRNCSPTSCRCDCCARKSAATRRCHSRTIRWSNVFCGRCHSR